VIGLAERSLQHALLDRDLKPDRCEQHQRQTGLDQARQHDEQADKEESLPDEDRVARQCEGPALDDRPDLAFCRADTPGGAHVALRDDRDTGADDDQQMTEGIVPRPVQRGRDRIAPDRIAEGRQQQRPQHGTSEGHAEQSGRQPLAFRAPVEEPDRPAGLLRQDRRHRQKADDVDHGHQITRDLHACHDAHSLTRAP
jgi:hypothetical protein